MDRAHLKFFTFVEIEILMKECGLAIEEVGGIICPIEIEDQQYIECLSKMDPSIPKNELSIYQYRIRAKILFK